MRAKELSFRCFTEKAEIAPGRIPRMPFLKTAGGIFMKMIPYNPDDPLSIDVSFKCSILGYYTPFMSCPLCRHYPCRLLMPGDIEMLWNSPLMEKVFSKLNHRRIEKMYIAKKEDGNLEMIESLDEKNPDPELLRDVVEVYVISKVLVPVMTLKPKPKEEQEKPPAEPAPKASKKRKEKK